MNTLGIIRNDILFFFVSISNHKSYQKKKKIDYWFSLAVIYVIYTFAIHFSTNSSPVCY